MLLLLALACCTVGDTVTTHEVAPGVVVQLASAPLDPVTHAITRDAAGRIRGIDGCIPHGVDHAPPAYVLEEARVLLPDASIELDASCMFLPAPFEASSVEAREVEAGEYELRGRFGAGERVYEATWTVTSAGSARTRLTSALRLRARLQAMAECRDRLRQRRAAAAGLEQWLVELQRALTDWRGSPVPAHAVNRALDLLEEATPSSSRRCAPSDEW